MLRQACKFNFCFKSRCFLLDSKRFKGHSHWQNIRHTKQANDNKRSLLISMYMRRMEGIVNSNNGDANPVTNHALANLLEQAKKNNLPISTFQGFLKKMTDRDVTPHQIYYRGPENYVIIITYDKKRQQFFRQAFKRVCRDSKIDIQEISSIDNVYTTKGIIVSKAPSTDITSAKAEEAAIIAGAEEVEEVESADKEEKFFQFITLQEDLWKVVKDLKDQGWTMYEHKHELVPLYYIELPEQNLSNLHDLVTGIEAIPEVIKVIVNIA